MMPPISRDLLVHDAELNNVVRDKFGSETDELIEHLYYVRLEPSQKVIVSSDNADIQCSALMFVDSVNTIPVGIPISVGNSILWEGKRYRVQQVNPFYDNVRLHHTEVLLSDG